MDEFSNWWALQEEDSNLAEFHAGAAWVASAERFKPKWDDAPEWANWLAMNESAEWVWFEDKPVQASNLWINFANREYCKMGNWKDTLEQRPV